MATELICIMRHELSVIVRCAEVKELLNSFWWAVLALLHWYLTGVHFQVIDVYDLLRVKCSLVQFHEE